LKLSRARDAWDVDLMINNPDPALGQRKWTAKGTERSA
jgi:hypothetical protein